MKKHDINNNSDLNIDIHRPWALCCIPSILELSMSFCYSIGKQYSATCVLLLEAYIATQRMPSDA